MEERKRLIMLSGCERGASAGWIAASQFCCKLEHLLLLLCKETGSISGQGQDYEEEDGKVCPWPGLATYCEGILPTRFAYSWNAAAVRAGTTLPLVR